MLALSTTRDSRPTNRLWLACEIWVAINKHSIMTTACKFQYFLFFSSLIHFMPVLCNSFLSALNSTNRWYSWFFLTLLFEFVPPFSSHCNFPFTLYLASLPESLVVLEKKIWRIFDSAVTEYRWHLTNHFTPIFSKNVVVQIDGMINILVLFLFIGYQFHWKFTEHSTKTSWNSEGVEPRKDLAARSMRGQWEDGTETAVCLGTNPFVRSVRS